MRQIRRALLLARKDLQLFLNDYGALFFAFLFPLIFVFAFSTFLPAADPDEPVEIHVATAEGADSLSRQLISGLTAVPGSGIVELTPEEARAQLDAEEIDGYILFPSEFTSNLTAGRAAEIRVATSNDAPRTAALLEGVAGSLASDLSARQAALGAVIALLAQSGQPPEQSALGNAISDLVAGQQERQVILRQERAGDVEPVPSSNYVLTGYVTMFIFFAAGFGAGELIRERNNNTFDRLLASGASSTTILAGKWLGVAARALAQAIVLWSAGVLVFGVDLGGSPLAVVAVTLAMLAASASFALLLASLVNSQKSADGVTVLAALSMAALGGSWWPLFIMPEWMQTLAKITPHAWANEAFNKLLVFGATTSDVLLNITVLFLFGAAFIVVALMRLRVRSA